MEIKLVKDCKNGYLYEQVLIDGKEYQFRTASRLLTNTSSEDGAGIFLCGAVNFWKGNMSKMFSFDESAEFATPEYVKILKKRIAEVREWVKSLDCEHQVTFSIPDP